MILPKVAILLILNISMITCNMKRIETAANGIAQIIDFCSEKYSIRFKLVVIDDHPDLLKVAGKVLKITNASLAIQAAPLDTS